MAETGMKVSISGDPIIGAAPKRGEAGESKDSLTAAKTFVSDPRVATRLQSQSGRDEFMSSIKLKKDSAFNRGDTLMTSFFGHIIDEVQGMNTKVASTNQTTGNKFDTNNLFAV